MQLGFCLLKYYYSYQVNEIVVLRHFTKTYALNLVTLRKWPIAVVEHPFTAIMQKCVEQVNMHVTPVLHICT